MTNILFPNMDLIHKASWSSYELWDKIEKDDVEFCNN